MFRKVLVSVEHDDGVAAVMRNWTRSLELTGYLEDGFGTDLDRFEPAVEGLTAGRAAQGGLLPPGARSAVVVGDTGERKQAAVANGAWVIVLDQATRGDPAPVHFLDERGRTVARPIPADWARTPVSDADEMCPACGASEWDEVIATDGSRGTHGQAEEPTPFLRCRECGHEDVVGVVISGEVEGPEPSPEEMRRAIRNHLASRREDIRSALEQVEFPIYALIGRKGELVGWGGETGKPVSSVTVAHGDWALRGGPRVVVETEREEDPFTTDRTLARDALAELIDQHADWPERSEPGVSAWLAAREREVKRAAALAEVVARDFAVDGVARSFELASVGDRWAAVSHHGDVLLTVQATDVAPEDVSLGQVSDPMTLLP